ncbi:hypothetical protein ALC56_01911 [Trachymyrmex septentrionalis]|uniref:Uncharacterized protein n=1 Tax=Trachymyrmex septentrionalis TaxID=34720 RepID=A0A195FUU6_9HYME|nr:hypothetical protein ALC56_01911 [Trachymyrmex septentrionalis]
MHTKRDPQALKHNGDAREWRSGEPVFSFSGYKTTETVLCEPYDEDIRGTRRPPKNFGRLHSCQEVVLHISHLVMLLGGSRRDGVRQLTRQGLFLAFGLRYALGRQSLLQLNVRLIT